MKRVRTVFSLKMWYQKSMEKYSDVSASSIPVMIPTDRTNTPHMLYNPILVKMHYAGLLHLHALHAVIVLNPLSLRGIPLLHGTQYPLRVIRVRILRITSPSNSHLHHQLDRQHSLRLHLRLFSPTLSFKCLESFHSDAVQCRDTLVAGSPIGWLAMAIRSYSTSNCIVRAVL